MPGISANADGGAWFTSMRPPSSKRRGRSGRPIRNSSAKAELVTKSRRAFHRNRRRALASARATCCGVGPDMSLGLSAKAWAVPTAISNKTRVVPTFTSQEFSLAFESRRKEVAETEGVDRGTPSEESASHPKGGVGEREGRTPPKGQCRDESPDAEQNRSTRMVPPSVSMWYWRRPRRVVVDDLQFGHRDGLERDSRVNR